MAAFLKAQAEEDAPLSMDELDKSAGGTCNAKTRGETAVSVITAGFGCTIWVTVSVTAQAGSRIAHKDLGHVFQQSEQDGRLCNI